MPAPGTAAPSPFDAASGATESRSSPFDRGGGRAPSPGPWRPPGAQREPSPGPWRPPAAQHRPEPSPWHYALPTQPPADEPLAPRADLHTDRTRYFVITSNTKENVVKSVRYSLWATQKKNERALDEAFQTAPAVILVFSVNRSDAFQGYALMRSPIGRPQSRSRDPFNGFGRLFDIEWLRLHDLPYREVKDVRNPLNMDRPVQFSRDGQELSNTAGRRLCGLIDRHIDDPDSFPKPEAQPTSTPAPPEVQLPQLYSLDHGPASIPPAVSRSSRSRSRSRGRRRKREKKYRRAPHPLEATFDEQVDFFLSLDFDDYVEWFRRFAAFSPGPTPPPGCPAPPPPGPAPGAAPHGHGAPPLLGPHSQPPLMAMPPMHGAGPPHHAGYPPMLGMPPPGHFGMPPPGMGHLPHFAPPMY